MILLAILIILYSIAYLSVYVLAHQDANMIRPLITMTYITLILMLITCVVAFSYGYWYISIMILFIIIGLLRFLFYLIKY